MELADSLRRLGLRILGNLARRPAGCRRPGGRHGRRGSRPARRRNRFDGGVLHRRAAQSDRRGRSRPLRPVKRGLDRRRGGGAHLNAARVGRLPRHRPCQRLWPRRSHHDCQLPRLAPTAFGARRHGTHRPAEAGGAGLHPGRRLATVARERGRRAVLGRGGLGTGLCRSAGPDRRALRRRSVRGPVWRGREPYVPHRR